MADDVTPPTPEHAIRDLVLGLLTDSRPPEVESALAAGSYGSATAIEIRTAEGVFVVEVHRR